MTHPPLCPITVYFGMPSIEGAIASYFAKHGVTEDVRDYLMVMEAERPDLFLELVCAYVEKEA